MYIIRVFHYTDQFQLIRVNNTIAFTWLSTTPKSVAVCMAWLVFLSSSFTVVYFTMEAILMMRGQMMSLFILHSDRRFFSVLSVQLFYKNEKLAYYSSFHRNFVACHFKDPRLQSRSLRTVLLSISQLVDDRFWAVSFPLFILFRSSS